MERGWRPPKSGTSLGGSVRHGSGGAGSLVQRIARHRPWVRHLHRDPAHSPFVAGVADDPGSVGCRLLDFQCADLRCVCRSPAGPGRKVRMVNHEALFRDLKLRRYSTDIRSFVGSAGGKLATWQVGALPWEAGRCRRSARHSGSGHKHSAGTIPAAVTGATKRRPPARVVVWRPARPCGTNLAGGRSPDCRRQRPNRSLVALALGRRSRARNQPPVSLGPTTFRAQIKDPSPDLREPAGFHTGSSLSCADSQGTQPTSSHSGSTAHPPICLLERPQSLRVFCVVCRLSQSPVPRASSVTQASNLPERRPPAFGHPGSSATSPGGERGERIVNAAPRRFLTPHGL